jgi:dCTP deaminase
MAVLTKREIIEKLKLGGIIFDPELDDFQIQPQSIDLRLGFTFYTVKTWEMTKKGRVAINVDYTNNVSHKNYFDTITLDPGQYFEIMPDEYVVATSYESIHLKHLDLMGTLFPRSSYNRRGLSVDIGGVIDSGYKGYLLIPIKNNTKNQTIRLYPGERICQVVFEQLSSALTSKETAVVSPHRKELRSTLPKELNPVSTEQDDERKYLIEGKLEQLKRDYRI